MEIRRARAGDVPGLVRLWLEFMDFHADAATGFVRSPDAVERWTEYITPKLEAEDVLVLVAEDGGELVGYLVARVLEYPPIVRVRRYGFVQEIAVTAARRREGIGRRLFARAERWLLERDVAHVELRINSDNETSRAFWVSLKFGPHTEYLVKRYA